MNKNLSPEIIKKFEEARKAFIKASQDLPEPLKRKLKVGQWYCGKCHLLVEPKNPDPHRLASKCKASEDGLHPWMVFVKSSEKVTVNTDPLEFCVKVSEVKN